MKASCSLSKSALGGRKSRKRRRARTSGLKKVARKLQHPLPPLTVLRSHPCRPQQRVQAEVCRIGTYRVTNDHLHCDVIVQTR